MEPGEPDRRATTSSDAQAWDWLRQGLRWRLQRLLGAIAKGSPPHRTPSPYVLPEGGYDAQRYWGDRHRRYRHSFRGVGDASKSEEQNLHEYVAAVGTIAELLAEVSFNPTGKSCLDIGCGNGFWTGILKAWGISAYTGVDITDALFDLLRNRFPDFRFISGSLPALPLEPGYQLITMIDVTQHITDDTELSRILEHVRALLAPDGVFVVTFWNQSRPQEQFYETFRPFAFYTASLEGLAHTAPRPFRDKFVAAFHDPRRRPEALRIEPLPAASILRVAEQVLAA